MFNHIIYLLIYLYLVLYTEYSQTKKVLRNTVFGLACNRSDERRYSLHAIYSKHICTNTRSYYTYNTIYYVHSVTVYASRFSHVGLRSRFRQVYLQKKKNSQERINCVTGNNLHECIVLDHWSASLTQVNMILILHPPRRIKFFYFSR